MPALLDALDLADEYQAGRLAVLVTEPDLCADPELVELVAWEVKYLLQGTGVVPYPRAELLPVLRADDPDLRRALGRVLSVEPSIRLSKADRSNDW